jgi:hypothetical protein
MQVRTLAVLVLIVGLASACGSAPTVSRIDLTEVAGVFVVAYSPRADVRNAMEDRLVADLSARSMIGHASHADILDVTQSSPEAVISAAQRRRAAAVLVVNQVLADSPALIANPARVSAGHPDLQAFFAQVRNAAPAPVDPAHEAIVEVNLFLLHQDAATLFWSGAALTRAADGSGAGLEDLSGQIADALDRAQRQLRDR